MEMLAFKPGKELTLFERKAIAEIGKNKDKWKLESKEKAWNDKRKT